MKKLLFIILVFLAIVAQGAWGQTASEYHVGQILYNAEQTTGFQAVGGGKLTSDGGWYNLLGHKLQNKPIERGVYIHNGDKMMIK